MTRVKRLDPSVAERIAAGEVVDRPASIVKELLENSLDAGATHIEVDIEEGGHQLIRVTDDGSGMSPEDARLAVERHATSKLTEWEDLDTLCSFGFRGEALPSIAAVSRFELVTTAKGETAGSRVTLEGPLSVVCEPAAGPEGTRIEVRDLFWNTPARRKFLKSASAEAGRVTELINRFAILHPSIGFRLTLNGKEKLFVSSRTTLGQRLANYWGVDLDALIEVDDEIGAIQVEGVVARPTFHRRNRTGQLIAVNKRLITSATLSQALREGFDPLLPNGRHPFGYLNLKLDPSAIDVNIHPTKAEVRFADSRAPFSAVARSVRNALNEERVETLNEKAWTATLDGGGQSAPVERAPQQQSFPQQSFSQQGISPMEIPPVLVSGKDYRQAPRIERQRSAVPQTQQVMELYRPPDLSETWQEPKAESERPHLTYLSRLYRTYLVMGVDDQLWIIDQHAAHERIHYERLHRFQITGPESQGLVVPYPLQLNAEERHYLETNRERFQEIGFDFVIDEDRAEITAVPPGLPGAQAETIFTEMVAELVSQDPSEQGRTVADLQEKLRAMMSCKASIRAREQISGDEAIQLVEDLIAADHSPYCPHGRPTRIRLDEKTLERLFHRT